MKAAVEDMGKPRFMQVGAMKNFKPEGETEDQREKRRSARTARDMDIWPNTVQIGNGLMRNWPIHLMMPRLVIPSLLQWLHIGCGKRLVVPLALTRVPRLI